MLISSARFSNRIVPFLCIVAFSGSLFSSVLADRRIILMIDSEYASILGQSWLRAKSALGLMPLYIVETPCVRSNYEIISKICSSSSEVAAVIAMSCGSKLEHILPFVNFSSIPLIRVPFAFGTPKEQSILSDQENWIYEISNVLFQALIDVFRLLKSYGVVIIHSDTFLSRPLAEIFLNSIQNQSNSSLLLNFCGDSCSGSDKSQNAAFIFYQIKRKRKLYDTVILIINVEDMLILFDEAQKHDFYWAGIQLVLGNPYISHRHLTSIGTVF